MTINIKIIKDNDFIALAKLYAEMNKQIPTPVSCTASVFSLSNDLTKKDFMAMGLYDDDKLIGFVTGYALSKVTFYFSGIYVELRNSNVSALIERSFSYVDGLGYKNWEADCTTENIKSILSKQGAYVMHTRMRKES